jgi:hypothetical protein
MPQKCRTPSTLLYSTHITKTGIDLTIYKVFGSIVFLKALMLKNVGYCSRW